MNSMIFKQLVPSSKTSKENLSVNIGAQSVNDYTAVGLKFYESFFLRIFYVFQKFLIASV